MPACPSGHESSATDFCDICGMRIDGHPPGSASPGAVASGSIGVTGGVREQCPQCGTGRAGLFCEVCGFDFSSATPSRPIATAGPGEPGQAAASSASASQVGGAGSSAAAPPGSSTLAREGANPPTGPAATPATAPATEAARPPSTTAAWTAIVTADRAYFDSVIAAGGPDAASIEFPQYCPERQFRLSGPQMRIGRRSVSRGLEPEIDLTGPPIDPGVSHLHAVLVAQPDGTWSVLDPGSSNGTQVNGENIATGEPVPLCDGDRVYVGAWTALAIHAVHQ